jgi:hypothetical protein
MPHLIDLTGQRFRTFTVRGRAPGPADARSAWWAVICDCGTERHARGDMLRADGSRCWKCDRGYLPCERSQNGKLGGSLAEIISNNSEFITECGCQIWTGDVDQNGYGKLRVDGKYIGAHRASWIAAEGSIPSGLFVLHRCDLPPCINFDHLFLGTQSDNIADYWAKRRRFEWLKRHYA